MSERRLVLLEKFPEHAIALVAPLDADVREAKGLAQMKLSDRANLLEREGWRAEDEIEWHITPDQTGIVATLLLTRHD